MAAPVCLTLGAVATNCYLYVDGDIAYLVDPADEAQRIVDALRHLQVKEYRVLLTHAHFDHILALNDLTPSAIYVHPLEEDALGDPRINLSAGMGKSFVLDAQILPVEDGSVVGPLRVLHTPGHRPGCVCYYDEAQGVLFSGDTLFASGYGRLDLPGAQPERMAQSLRRLLSLPPDTRVYPGHGAQTTIGEERGVYGI